LPHATRRAGIFATTEVGQRERLTGFAKVLESCRLARLMLNARAVTSLYKNYCKLLSALAVGGALASGCATGGQKVHDAQYAGLWKVRLPASQGVYGLGKAGGNAGAATAAVQPVTNVDEYLKPEYAKATTPRAVPMRERRLLAASATPVATPVVAATEPEPTPALTPTPAPVTQPAPYALRSEPRPDELERYATREARSQREQSFRGGDAIVISLSAIVIIGLIILLIVLLT
jgi:hypothetical protein